MLRNHGTTEPRNCRGAPLGRLAKSPQTFIARSRGMTNKHWRTTIVHFGIPHGGRSSSSSR
jgi:hypothetical protein